MSPEETKALAIVTVTVASFAGALLYPIAKAYARRLEGRGSNEGLRQDLAEITARLESLQQGQERMAELEERLEFAERLLAKQRDPERLGG